MATSALESGTRDLSLDGWRGVAVVGVLFDHFVTRDFLNFGRLGVEMFFVLSGMLMAEILFVKQASIGTFFLRRFARIYPAMFVFATLLFIYAQVTHLAEISPQAYLSVLTFTANYVSVLWHRTYDYDHIWSLCIEQHTYICLGLIATLSRWKSLSPVWITACVAALAIVNGAIDTWWLHWHYNLVYWRTDVRGASILMGAVAFMVLRDPRLDGGWIKAPWVSPAFAALALALNINAIPDPIKYSLGTTLLAVSAASLARAPAWYKSVFESRVLVAIGVVSYSIYLWQEPFNEIDDSRLKILLLPVGLGLGVASYFLVETPARRALNGLVRSRTRMPRPAL